MTRSWDVFCSVVDNFGDIGVCWRLSRLLSAERGQAVRLWVDDLVSFQRLCHEVDPSRLSQWLAGVEVRLWSTAFPQVEPADIVIEGFGVRLPETYIERMASRKPPPVWINLEYLSAETWVEGCHGLSSPQATLPLLKYFFFPGFTSATGGLLMEHELARERDTFQRDPQAVAAFWDSLNVAPAHDKGLHLSLFCYDNAALAALVEAWSTDVLPIICVVPEGKVLATLSQIAGRNIAIRTAVKLGNLTIHAVPFLELDQYDRLLWACDFNFVRGEDSFVRAQLASRPLAWQAYPQENHANLSKVSAFLGHYADGLDPAARLALVTFWEAWNQGASDIGAHWRALQSRSETYAVHARNWAGHLASGGKLADQLAAFCENRLK